MATEIELKTAARKLGADVQEVLNDSTLSASEKGAKLDNLQAESERIGAELKNLERARALMSGVGSTEKQDTPQADAGPVYRSLGEELVASDAYRYAVQQKGAGARFSTNATIGLKTQGATGMMGESTSGTTAGSALSGYFLAGTAGPAILPNFLPGIVEQRFFPLTIQDLFADGSTDSPVISYLKETAWTNNAAATGEGATMPYSTDAIARVQDQVGKVTNIHKITDEMLQDASQYVSFLNNRLVLGVQRQSEVQLLAGTGYPGVSGLLNRSSGFSVAQGQSSSTDSSIAFPASGTAGAGEASSTIGTLTYGRTITGVNSDDLDSPSTLAYPDAHIIANALFGMLTDIRFQAFCEPDAFIINPYDWQIIRLGRDKQGQYLGGSYFGADYGQPQNAGESLWGKKVVVTPVIPQGYILGGAFKENGQVFNSKGITVEMVNTNGTDFEQGLVSVRATARMALAVYRPQAFQLAKLVAAAT